MEDVLAEIGGSEGASVFVLDGVPAIRDGLFERDLKQRRDGTRYPRTDERGHFPCRRHQTQPGKNLDVPFKNTDNILAHLVDAEHVVRNDKAATDAGLLKLFLAVSVGFVRRL